MNWARAGFLVGLTVACLAALGLDAWLRRPTRRRLAGVALATQAAVAALALSAPGTPGTGPRLTLVLPSVLAAVAAAPAVAPVTVPILVGLETVANGWHVLPGSRPASPTSGEPPCGAAQNAFLDRVVGGWQKRIRIADRAAARRDRFDRINHPRRAAGVKHITRKRGGR